MPLLRPFACLAAAAALLFAVPAQAARPKPVAHHTVHHGPAHLRTATFHMRPHHSVARRVSAPVPSGQLHHHPITRTAYHPLHTGS